MVSLTAPDTQTVILASASETRKALLKNAGVDVKTEKAHIDEASVKQSMLSQGAPVRDIADRLAELKAQRIAQRHLGAIVIGCDQILVQSGELFSKPAGLAEARAQLLALRGMTHELLSAVVIFENGHAVWRHIGCTKLTMRNFSKEFLDGYLAENQGAALQSVGCYHLEGIGAQLFSRVQGDYFCVLGLPLLEVLAFLRTRGVCLE